MTGIELITQERIEQIEKHRRTPDWDKKYNKNGQLVQAAKAVLTTGYAFTPSGWNTDVFDKMRSKDYKNSLILAGALIAAEIDRITD